MRVFNLNERENSSNNHAKRTSALCFVLISLIAFINQIDSLLNSTDHHILNENEYVAKDEVLSLLAPSFSNECKSDLHCVDGKFCLNGSCVDTCYNGDTSDQCIYFHCNSKQLVTNESSSNIIETNNYPQLSSYFSNQKCSWLLKSRIVGQTNNQNNNNNNSKSSLPFIQLSFSRFSTLHTSDYLYIFDGDSIYSPMIASLSGYHAPSANPWESINFNQTNLSSFLQDTPVTDFTDERISQINFLNQSKLFLLFKSDVTPLYSTLNSFSSLSSQHQSSFYEINEHKPSGIAIKYKISDIQVTSNTGQHNCSNCNESHASKLFKNIFEQVDYENDFGSKQSLNSSLRRALFCSFRIDDTFYVVGGYSFRKINFMTRLDLVSMRWDHSPDQNPSSIHNRSNRRFYSNLNYKQPTLNLPQNRYAHSCVVDKNQFFMYGGVKYDINDENLINKESTNELWSYQFETNKWSLLNPMSKDTILKNYILPLPVSGHSMHLITKYGNFNEQPNKSLLIFFGYSEYYGSTLSIIQEYNLASKSWILHNVSNINIGFSHSSFHDPTTNLIYFHGGVLLNTYIDTNEASSSSPSKSTSSSSLFNLFDSFGHKPMRPWPSSPYTYSSNRLKQIQTPTLSPMLYNFNAENFEWNKMAKTTISSYMHSMAYYENHLIVYGGININEETISIPYKSNHLRLFSIRNNKWLKKIELNKTMSVELGLEKTLDAVKFSNHERTGHGSFIYNNSLFTFGGFNGYFLNDLFKFDLKLIDFDDFNFILKKKRRRRQIGKIVSSDDGPTISGGPSVKFKSFKFQSYLSQQSPSTNNVGTGSSSLLYNQQSQTSSHSDEDIFGNKIPSKSSSASYFYDYISNNHDQPIDFLAIYDPKSNMKHLIESCTKYKNCQSCHLDPKCVWNLKTCENFSVLNYKSNVTLNVLDETLGNSILEANLTHESVVFMRPTCSQTCDEYKSCSNCTLSNSRYKNDCVWCASQLKCILASSLSILDPFGECVNLITKRNECERSVTNVDLNAAHSMTAAGKKFWPSSSEYYYYQGFCEINHSNCSSCISDERCGWCSLDTYDFLNIKNYNKSQSILFDYSLNTGFGTCMEGGESFSQGDRCKANWFFTKCPSCECNGHSKCSSMFNITSLNESSTFKLTDAKSNSYVLANEFYLPYTSTCGECLNNTEGEFCSRCKDGYFGNPKNNGFCAECDCGMQASLCDYNNGKCFCSTKGVTGHKCDQCDAPRYLGKPNLDGGSCFYNLTTDYQFTFNLNKDSDRYYTQINFVNHPLSGSDDDIDFMVRCIRENALINITYILQSHSGDTSTTSTTNPTIPYDLSNLNETQILKFNWNTSSRPAISPIYTYNFASSSSQSTQMKLLTQINCTATEFKYTFSNRDLNYASRDKSPIFVVYVYAFQTPITIQIAFSRRSRVQLLHFFITFFGCLLSLLTIAFITWKSKQRYDRFRRQRQIVIQMEHMASRPFTRLVVDITKKNEPFIGANNNEEKMHLVEGSCAYEADVKALNQSFFSINKNVTNDFKTRKSSRRKLKKFMENRKNSFTNGSLKERLTTSKEQATTTVQNSLKIMPVAIEPLSNNKTGILTCLIKLPQGDLNYTPKGSSPFMLASAYVQINPNSSFINVPHMLAAKNDTDDFLNEKIETKTEI